MTVTFVTHLGVDFIVSARRLSNEACKTIKKITSSHLAVIIVDINIGVDFF